MANLPYDEELINALERPLSSDINMASTYAQLATRMLIQSTFNKRTSFNNDAQTIFPTALSAAFFGSSFRCRCTAPASLQVTLDAGLGIYNTGTSDTSVGGVSGLNDPSFLKPLVLTSAGVETTTGIGPIPTNVSGNPRIDIIEVSINRFLTDATSRDVLNPTTGQFSPQTVNKTLSYSLNNTADTPSTGSATTAIHYKVGTPAGVPVAPTADAGYVIVAQLYVPTGSLTISQSMIIDSRLLLFPGGKQDFQVTVQPQGIVSTAYRGYEIPPGMQFGARGYSAAGFPGIGVQYYLIAGDASQLSPSGGVSFLQNIDNGFDPPLISLTPPAVVSVDSAIQTLMAGCQPPLLVGIGQNVITGTLIQSPLGLSGGYAYLYTQNPIVNIAGSIRY